MKGKEWVTNKVKNVNHISYQNPNPMQMTPFEQACARQEVEERERAKYVYTCGIQGVDGDGASKY